MAGFRNNFQDHGRLLEQLLGSQAAIIKPEQAPRRGLLKELSQLVSDFIEASTNLIFGFSSQNDSQKL
jgi:hypothetical protein